MIAFIKRRALLLIIVSYIFFLLLAGLAEDIEAQVVILTLIYTIFIVLPWLVWKIIVAFRARKELKQTELQHLKSQVNPHFFFNTLNLLYGTVEKDKEQAKDLILKLSDLMRYSIYDGQKDFVSLEEEVQYLQGYIELQKARFHKNIDITFDINIVTSGIEVMPLLFIILVENAFKHGAENLRKEAYIRIKINSNDKDIKFRIENNFDPEIETEKGGLGLKNLRRRLELGYPKQHEFLEEIDHGVYIAQLTLTVA